MRKRVVIHGYVQGVFFRDSLSRLAARHGIVGWARNRPDGTVEAVFEGSGEDVERLVAFAREGPRGAHVDGVDIFEEADEGLADFAIR